MVGVSCCQNPSWSLKLFLLGAMLAALWRVASPCGVLTHIEIGHRALSYFADRPGSDLGYKPLIEKHQDAFQAGNPYPDAMYASICYHGNYHDVAEDSHWTPFMVATIDYIWEVYPQPWNQTAEKLVVFLMGFVSHQIADVLWHNLGIQNGFLQSMADADFHGQFGLAHPQGDLGGDVVGSLEWNKTFVKDVSWYVPSQDLNEIYKRYYAAQGRTRNVTKAVIEECTTLLFLARLGEKIALEKIFPEYAKKSPFLVEELNEFYIGGLYDNAAWTTLLWDDAITMLANGTNTCEHAKSPIDVHCPGQAIRLSNNGADLRSVPPVYNNFLDRQFVEVERVDGGIRIKPSASGRELLDRAAEEKAPVQAQSVMKSAPSPSVIYTSSVPYARLGWTYAQGDLNGDSYPDLVITAPGYSVPHSAAIGCVYIVFVNATGFPGKGRVDIESVASGKLLGQERFSRFGTSVAILDFNQDGHLDLAVGAPSTGTANLSYHGAVKIFFNDGKGAFGPVPNITIPGVQAHQNFGWSMASGDVDQDGFADLLVSSPFISLDELVQNGIVEMYKSSNSSTPNLNPFTTLVGPVRSSWFGWTLEVVQAHQQTLLLVGAPGANICNTSRDCASFSSSDLQTVGNLSVFSMADGKTFSQVMAFSGQTSFEKMGTSAAVGRMFPNTDVLAVSAPTANVEGHILGVPATLQQAGRVLLYNLSNADVTSPFAVLEGDREYGRFGWKVAFSDMDNDGLDDLVITAALRIADITEIVHAGEAGATYMFLGGDHFRQLKWPTVTNDCGTVAVESPCPEKVASEVIMGKLVETNSRFGSSLNIVKAGNGTSALVVGALHSNLGARISGSVYVF